MLTAWRIYRGEVMTAKQGSRYIEDWPEESREPARLVIDQYGEPDEVTETQLTWHKPGPWKRVVASKAFYQHDFPTPHIDSVESVVDYRVPVGKFTQLAEFDGRWWPSAPPGRCLLAATMSRRTFSRSISCMTS
jgi:hypothetical protein